MSDKRIQLLWGSYDPHNKHPLIAHNLSLDHIIRIIRNNIVSNDSFDLTSYEVRSKESFETILFRMILIMWSRDKLWAISGCLLWGSYDPHNNWILLSLIIYPCSSCPYGTGWATHACSQIIQLMNSSIELFERWFSGTCSRKSSFK